MEPKSQIICWFLVLPSQDSGDNRLKLLPQDPKRIQVQDYWFLEFPAKQWYLRSQPAKTGRTYPCPDTQPMAPSLSSAGPPSLHNFPSQPGFGPLPSNILSHKIPLPPKFSLTCDTSPKLTNLAIKVFPSFYLIDSPSDQHADSHELGLGSTLSKRKQHTHVDSSLCKCHLRWWLIGNRACYYPPLVCVQEPALWRLFKHYL